MMLSVAAGCARPRRWWAGMAHRDLSA